MGEPRRRRNSQGGPLRGMKTRSRDQGRTAGVGSVKRRSPGFGAMGETRRFQTFPPSPGTGRLGPKPILRPA
jgi:hypothetical protein